MNECSYINLDLSENRFPIEDRRKLRAVLRSHTLEYVNEHSKPVNPRVTFYSRVVKRVLDVILSGAALIVSLPINLIIGIITYFDVGFPLFFKQERVGKDGKTFMLVKFRNMTNETDANGELLPAPQRVTKWGNFVRKTSLDELLNFWSIFKGDMSIIGPRPLPIGYNESFSNRHWQRTAVRPGLECPPISRKTDTWTWTDQLENDIEYVESVSFKTDVAQFLRLIRLVFDRKQTGIRGAGLHSTLMGYLPDGTCIETTAYPLEALEYLEEIGYTVVDGKVKKLEAVKSVVGS